MMQKPDFKASTIAVNYHAAIRFCQRALGIDDPTEDQVNAARNIIRRRLQCRCYYKKHEGTGKIQHLFTIDCTDLPIHSRVFAFVQENTHWKVEEDWFIRTIMTDAEWTSRKGYFPYDK